MHQKVFATSPDVFLGFFKNMFLMVWEYAQKHQNRFFTPQDGKKYPF
jgi:hypothetical protein